LGQKFWAEVVKKSKNLPLIAPDKLSLQSFDTCKDEAEAIAVTKSILKDFGVSDTEILSEVQLFKQLQDVSEEGMDDEEFSVYRRNLLDEIKKEAAGSKMSADEAIVSFFYAPFHEKGGDGSWLKPYCIEFILTTIIDNKPGFELHDEWEEDTFLEKVNSILETRDMKFSYDPDYDWEDTSGSAPLPVNLETMAGDLISSVKHTFEDPEQFDQQDLMQPINKLLESKDLKFMDASWVSEETLYTWLLFPVKDAKRLEKKYGSLSEWYQFFPEREAEEGEEGEEGFEEGEDEVEVEEVTPQKSSKKFESTKKLEVPNVDKKRK